MRKKLVELIEAKKVTLVDEKIIFDTLEERNSFEYEICLDLPGKEDGENYAWVTVQFDFWNNRYLDCDIRKVELTMGEKQDFFANDILTDITLNTWLNEKIEELNLNIF